MLTPHTSKPGLLLCRYELAWLEHQGRIKRGDRIWQLVFGSGFKCNSSVSSEAVLCTCLAHGLQTHGILHCALLWICRCVAKAGMAERPCVLQVWVARRSVKQAHSCWEYM